MADAIKSEVGSFPPQKKITVMFVLGGPGTGKGTQCSNIVKHFGFTHLSAGDLLREEAKSDTEQGTMVKNPMQEGKLVPSELIVKLLLKAMLHSGNDKFVVVIDGFPRNEELPAVPGGRASTSWCSRGVGAHFYCMLFQGRVPLGGPRPHQNEMRSSMDVDEPVARFRDRMLSVSGSASECSVQSSEFSAF